MPDLLPQKVHVAEDRAQIDDGGFQLVSDASLTVSKAGAWRRPRAQDPPAGAAASNFAVWVSTIFRLTELKTVPSDPPVAAGFFLNSHEVRFVRQIREDLGELGDPMRDSAAAELCRKFAEGVGLELANKPGIRVAAFADENDMITLVAHYRPAKRQASFEFHADGKTVSIVSIDEQMHRAEQLCGVSHVETIRNVIAWLINRS